MANQPIVSSDLSSLQMTYLSNKFVRVGQVYGNPLKSFIDVSADIGNRGGTVNYRVAPKTSSTLITEGAAVTFDNSTGSTVPITLNKQREISFEISSLAESIQGNAQAEMLIDSAITGLYNDVVADCLSLITSGVTTNVVGTYNTALTQDVILAAGSKLDDVNAQGKRIGLLRHGTNSWDAFSKLITWTNTGVVSPLVNGTAGRAYDYNDVSWYKTQALPKNTNNTDNCILTPGAIGIAMRPLAAPIAGALYVPVVDAESGFACNLVMGYDATKGGNYCKAQVLYGVAMIKESYSVLIKS